MTSPYEISICANTKARQLDNNKLKDLQDIFKTQGIKYNLLTPASLQKAAAKNLGSTIVAVGGDGTVNAAAGMALKYARKLAVVPQGTFNHFAKDLGLPLDLAEATTRVASGKTRAVDIGQVNERVFLNNSVIGIYPHLVVKRELLQGKVGKWLAAVISVVWSLPRTKTYRLQLKFGGKDITVRTKLLVIANNKYDLQNFGLASRNSLVKGLLYIYVIKPRNINNMLGLSIRLLLGMVRDSDFDCYEAKQVEVASTKAMLRVAIDGESIVLKTPLTYKSLHKSLQVIA